jgi:hypothetical protein
MKSRFLGVALALLPAAAADAQPGKRPLPASDAGWELRNASVEKADGRETIAVETGFAYRRDVSLMDGAIDFDVQVSRRRSFVYVMFRIADDREFEEMYLRPHKSGLPDALQYAPVFQGQSAWQLHHGEGGVAAVEFEPGAWTHVRLVLQGRRAALFVGDMQKPALFVPRLAREPKAGYFALRGFVPAGSPGAGPSARFADVTITTAAGPPDLAALEAPAPASDPGVIRAWAVSRAFLPKDAPEAALPSNEVAGGFRRLETEPDGLLALHRHVTLPAGSRAAAGVARVNVRAAAAGVRAIDLGWSDVATVFLNGRPLFRADHSYSYEKRREGLIGYEQARLFLPLAAGDNELAVVVSDGFGGWGIMGRFANPEGLTVEAR